MISSMKKLTRRDFLNRFTYSIAGGSLLAMSAKSMAGIQGANDRVQIGLIGAGHRGHGHIQMIKLSKDGGKNIEFRSLCDIWSRNRSAGTDYAKKVLGVRPKTFQYSEDLLDDDNLDAVMIATGDHQHVMPLVKSVKAGKDVYCEKPMANTIEQAKEARDTVRNGSSVVQMGSQWVSEPHQLKVREIIRSGKLGKITKIEQSWNYNGPRWYDPKGPNVTTIKENETDWERWLAGRPWVPFDPEKYFFFRIFRDYSGGITDQWFSHGSGLAHFYLDTFIPDEVMADGGIFAWHDARENPDTMTIISKFNTQEVLYTYTTNFGNSYGDHTIIRGKEGTLFAKGGEGSPQWWYQPETRSSWRSNFVFEKDEVKTEPTPVLLPGESEIPPTDMSDNSKEHMDNWIDCIRSRKTPHGSIETGFAHSIAVIMATRSYREGKKLYWNRENEVITENPPA